jgi:glycosyltransferase involved in cell wall biosynthesis
MPASVSEIAGAAIRDAAVAAVIPCVDEEEAIGGVVAAVRAQGVAEVIVVDGGSRDRTIEVAVSAGARVVVEKRCGYGRAVQAGIAAAPHDTEILLFLDGDGSDRPECIPALLAPIRTGRAVFVTGSRVRGEREPGSLSAQQVVAGHVAGFLLRAIYGAQFTDMSPFRAIRRDAFDRLGMRETTYGLRRAACHRSKSLWARGAGVVASQRYPETCLRPSRRRGLSPLRSFASLCCCAGHRGNAVVSVNRSS